MRLLIRRSSSLRWLEGTPVEYAYGDVRDKASLAGACSGVRSVFHLGGLTRARTAGEFLQVNGAGTRNLAEALAERGIPGGVFLYVSSLAAGGPAIALERDPEPCRLESDPPAPVTAYGRSKLEGEVALREVADAHGRFRHVILRPPAVYGPRDEATLLLFRCLKQGIFPIPSASMSRLSLICVHDLVDGILRSAESGVRGTYYISDGVVYNWREIGAKAAEIMDVAVRVLRVPYASAVAAAAIAETWGLITGRAPVLHRGKVREIWQPHWVCSPAKAQREWGFTAGYDLERGLEETLTWYRLNQWL